MKFRVLKGFKFSRDLFCPMQFFAILEYNKNFGSFPGIRQTRLEFSVKSRIIVFKMFSNFVKINQLCYFFVSFIVNCESSFNDSVRPRGQSIEA